MQRHSHVCLSHQCYLGFRLHGCLHGMIWKAVRNSFSSSVRVCHLAGDIFLVTNPKKWLMNQNANVDLHWGNTTDKRSDKLIAGSSVSLSFHKRQQRKAFNQIIDSDILSPLIHVTILVLRHHQHTIIFAFSWELLIGWWRRPLFLCKFCTPKLFYLARSLHLDPLIPPFFVPHQFCFCF